MVLMVLSCGARSDMLYTPLVLIMVLWGDNCGVINHVNSGGVDRYPTPIPTNHSYVVCELCVPLDSLIHIVHRDEVHPVQCTVYIYVYR